MFLARRLVLALLICRVLMDRVRRCWWLLQRRLVLCLLQVRVLCRMLLRLMWLVLLVEL